MKVSQIALDGHHPAEGRMESTANGIARAPLDILVRKASNPARIRSGTFRRNSGSTFLRRNYD